MQGFEGGFRVVHDPLISVVIVAEETEMYATHKLHISYWV